MISANTDGLKFPKDEDFNIKYRRVKNNEIKEIGSLDQLDEIEKDMILEMIKKEFPNYIYKTQLQWCLKTGMISAGQEININTLMLKLGHSMYQDYDFNEV